MAGALIQSWDEIEGKVKSKVGQLTGLLQHFTASSESDSDIYYQSLASQHDTEIEEILRETVGRLQLFRDAMQYRVEGDHIKAAAEKNKTQAVRLEAENELNAYKKTSQERQEALEATHNQKMELVGGNMALMRETLDKATTELETTLETISRLSDELEEAKRLHEKEIGKERIERKSEVEALLQKHEAELRARIERQEEEQMKQEASHEDLMDQLRAYYKDEISRLKVENKEKVSTLQQNYDALQYDLTTEKLAIQNRLTVVYKEREALAKETAMLKGSLREANSLIENAHAEHLQTRSSLEDDIQVLKEDNRHLVLLVLTS
ncbi:centrosomal protein of 112 kDa-like isoform X1 [Selaginella moellendorffii]|uniref:centrosomal protein of 112 kDa-like isoform X1 n=1 Tax=Selaginella moellendorffii TaxID=88036 RepID=UPI000D1D0926|nr:centrosomal protein of 112 kDa-like isoform X1 [Selaginella moellendorffii]|eukprot:XP_024540983.1 centrosomal protein of 112 kDa-like isoform X1 [Selaginella moellendorffii]